MLISHVDAWYLDCGFGRWRETGDAACDPYRPWQTVYNHRPWQQLRLNKKQILGKNPHNFVILIQLGPSVNFGLWIISGNS